VLSQGNVDLLVASGVLGLLFALQCLLLGGIGVALVNVLRLLRIVLRFSAGTLGFLVNRVRVTIGLGDIVPDLLLEKLGDRRANDTEQEWLEEAEQQLELRFLQLDVEVLHIDSDRVDLEEMLSIARVRSRHCNLEAEAGSTQENVHKTRVGDRWEALLLLDVIADIYDRVSHALDKIK